MKYRLVFNGSIYEKQANALRNRIAEILLLADCAELTVVFSSDGGSTDQGLSLYNFIRALPRPVHFHAAGHVGSIAVPAFLGARKRTCAPFSRFFSHAYDWTFTGPQLRPRLEEALQRLDSDISLSRAIVEKHTTLAPSDIESLYGPAVQPKIFTADDAKTAGIVEDVRELNPTGQEEPDVRTWTTGWNA